METRAEGFGSTRRNQVCQSTQPTSTVEEPYYTTHQHFLSNKITYHGKIKSKSFESGTICIYYITVRKCVSNDKFVAMDSQKYNIKLI